MLAEDATRLQRFDSSLGYGTIRHLAPSTRGGDPIRRLLPWAVGALIVLGALRVLGQKAGLYGTTAGTAVFAVAFCALLVFLLLYVARIADRAEEERLRAERANEAAAPALAERAAELERANAELAATTARLERSNEELQRFATVASHDLREPLRVVSGFADLLARRFGGDLGTDGNRFVGAITTGVARMDEMISDLLAYARAGRIDQPLEPVDTNAVVADVLSDLQRAIEDSQADVEVEPLPVVNGNAAALRQLFQNLVANAIKFVDEAPPRIRIWAAEVPEGWRFSVRDNGIGIDPREAERIFGMFTRLHGAERYSGTGVGLAVCQRIVDVHGGRIWVESAPGGGSQFMFTIARAPATPA
jgi:light-regulated signal transduction histidine kinase (bacteriophytochrome)